MEKELLDEIGRVAVSLAQHMRLEATAAFDSTDAGVSLNFTGRDVDLLLQRNGAVLYAFEYILNRIFARRLGADQKITADAGGFRALREEELRLMALKACEKVMAYGESVGLQPMLPHERRIIHLALQDQPKVRTVSEGFGEERKVVIVPA